ncbi:ABC transporter ATP-binding protein [Leptolyngbya sp. FACHB-711]|uniref:ABC transporter ATP-binding protein n=1 Tax=unclassified Leptolyngbya TaxID=2650499 RepID=UPI0016835999|nr:ABC transporter ATP-binding protein [Leptolyngbya sp. FACHB-711]MBD1851211.1 ABC transporter ATP-binding protein [Cyanobacteria bacterium FACHB-502]MBD2023962.1 ABC transporter ATP-binding protein [Leptolyngbya sp. FACHB-711]
MPEITLSHVNKVYANGTVALQDLNLAIAQGQFISLLGPSGCGKSTVLRLIAGLGKMTTGNVSWGNPNHRLAYVFQEAALMPWATVEENVRLPLKLAGLTKRATASAVAEAIERVDLRGFEKCYPRELSGGMKMRVSIARALVTKPELLLMDEPFGALDEMTRSKLNSDLLDLWQQMQWTVIFVTHNIYEAIYLSNRVVVMAARPGRVVADVAIDAPYPRTEAFRASAAFTNYYRRLSTTLSMGTDPELEPWQPADLPSVPMSEGAR